MVTRPQMRPNRLLGMHDLVVARCNANFVLYVFCVAFCYERRLLSRQPAILGLPPLLGLCKGLETYILQS